VFERIDVVIYPATIEDRVMSNNLGTDPPPTSGNAVFHAFFD
jgi:hypothetical protein